MLVQVLSCARDGSFTLPILYSTSPQVGHIPACRNPVFVVHSYASMARPSSTPKRRRQTASLESITKNTSELNLELSQRSSRGDITERWSSPETPFANEQVDRNEQTDTEPQRLSDTMTDTAESYSTVQEPVDVEIVDSEPNSTAQRPHARRYFTSTWNGIKVYLATVRRRWTKKKSFCLFLFFVVNWSIGFVHASFLRPSNVPALQAFNGTVPGFLYDDAHQILGLGPQMPGFTFPTRDIKKAYRRYGNQYHPDKLRIRYPKIAGEPWASGIVHLGNDIMEAYEEYNKYPWCDLNQILMVPSDLKLVNGIKLPYLKKNCRCDTTYWASEAGQYMLIPFFMWNWRRPQTFADLSGYCPPCHFRAAVEAEKSAHFRGIPPLIRYCHHRSISARAWGPIYLYRRLLLLTRNLSLRYKNEWHDLSSRELLRTLFNEPFTGVGDSKWPKAEQEEAIASGWASVDDFTNRSVLAQKGFCGEEDKKREAFDEWMRRENEEYRRQLAEEREREREEAEKPFTTRIWNRLLRIWRRLRTGR